MKAITSEVNIRSYKKGDKHQIVKLFGEVFGQPMTVEHWNWKYSGQGFLDNKSVVATDERGNIIGHFGAITLDYWIRCQGLY